MNKLKEFIEQLRNLDPNEPGRWPLSVRIGTIVLLFVIAAAAGYWYFVWKAKRPELLEARAQETQLWSTLETKARKAANLQAYKDQLAEMEKSFGAMLRQLPDKTEVPNLLVDISQTGLAAGLEEKLFQPQNEIRKDFYAELPISISLTGTYHEMGNFASGIAALPRIVTLHDIEIAPPGREGRGGSQGATPGDLVINVTAKTYRYLDEEEQAAEADAGGKDKPKEKPKGASKGGRSEGSEG
jgi:type IV pilus assembly protein PilO